jgi:hypothetical protein
MIYVVFLYTPYEGLGEPELAFTSEAMAQAYADQRTHDEDLGPEHYVVRPVELV